jgi:hypothetical protein
MFTLKRAQRAAPSVASIRRTRKLSGDELPVPVGGGIDIPADFVVGHD